MGMCTQTLHIPKKGLALTGPQEITSKLLEYPAW